MQNVTMLHPTPFGALTPLFAGTSEEALNYNGEVCSIFLRRAFPADRAAVSHPVGASREVPTGDVRRRGRREAMGVVGGRGQDLRCDTDRRVIFLSYIWARTHLCGTFIELEY